MPKCQVLNRFWHDGAGLCGWLRCCPQSDILKQALGLNRTAAAEMRIKNSFRIPSNGLAPVEADDLKTKPGCDAGRPDCTAVAGVGMPRPGQRATFQKFARGDAAKEAGIKGTGIGLAIVPQIVDAMHGEIRFKSEIGADPRIAQQMRGCLSRALQIQPKDFPLQTWTSAFGIAIQPYGDSGCRTDRIVAA